jgi:hypothetical protein
MKTVMRFLACVCLAATMASAFAGETWQDALNRMPLGANITALDRTNCVPLMLNAFQSNGVVKALIFMPGATDELYFFRRVHAILTNANPTLLEAVSTLTNHTFIQATFRPPFLLLHTTEDALDGFAAVKNESTAAKLRQRIVPGRVRLEDADWQDVRDTVNGQLRVGLRPFPNAMATWHFYRHNFVACGVTDWEMLETLALAGKTTFTVNWLTVDFQPDRRAGVTPKLEKFPGN